ncbi:pancreatic lipase-related protein 2-like [Acropora palmata]|uniref:pancreatic lipase-related protein 2-like n=1 Tax=Acropora palmata TaxID=6131 RepID=UPI003D9FBA2D
MKDALLQREDCNVICIDWAGSAKRLYEQSVGNTRLVGAEIAELVKFIINKNGGSKHLADRFYIIGFSLGGQIAGYAGKSLRDNGMLLGRITGLDPASPYYTDRDPDVRLDPTDAKYVDVIHTNLPIIASKQRVGHIDFFPNGGSVQPGCFTNKPLDVIFTTSCHNLRAPEYYIATVQNQCSWKAYPCSSYLWFWSGLCNTCYGECPSMGYSADKTKHTGSYFLDTTSKKPFCEAGLVNDTVPPSTKYKNRWAVNIFAEWQSLREVKVPVLDCGGVFKDYELHKVCALSADIAAMDVLSLNYWLSKFVMEVAKKSGERYPPKSVYGITCSLKRHLEERNGSEALNPLDASDKRFVLFRRVIV